MTAAMSTQAAVSHYYDYTADTAGNVTGVATDASGNVFVVGNFTGIDVDFDPGPGTDYRNSSNYAPDGFVTKFNADGSYAWTQIFKTNFGSANGYGAFPGSVAIDSADNVYIAGGYGGPDGSGVDLDPGAGSDIHSAPSFVVKLFADGSYAWARDLMSAGMIKIDANDNIYLTGNSAPGSFDFDPTAGVDNISVTGGTAAYISKFHADGSYVWTRLYTAQYSGDTIDIEGFSFDSSGNIVLVGNLNPGYSTTSGVDVDPGTATVMVTPTTTGSFRFARFFVTQLQASGVYGGWFFRTELPYYAIALDSHDNIYLAGGSYSENNYKLNPFVEGGVLADEQYMYHASALTRINGHTSYGWTRVIGGSGGFNIMIDSTDHVYMVSHSDGGNLLPYVPNSLTRFTPDGTMSWSNSTFDNGSTLVGASMDNSYNIYIAGYGLTKFTYDTSNTAPVASNDAFSMDQGVNYDGFLSASDADGDSLTYSIVANGALGTAVITDASTGAFSYTPGVGSTGTDSFSFIAHDGQKDSNIATVTVTINAAQSGIDLTMTAIGGASQADPGKSTPISTTVMNLGTDNSGTFKVGIYLSVDNIITTGDTKIGERSSNSLSVNASSTVNSSVTIPAGTALGNYYIGAIADYQNVVEEFDEGNNTIATPFEVTLPDLVVSSLTGPAAPAAPDSTVTLSGIVTNQGHSQSSLMDIGLYMSTDSTITTSDTLVGDVFTGGIEANATKSFSMLVDIPSGLSPGTYYFGAIADYENVVEEMDEGNNTASTPVTVFIPTPDLVISSMVGPTEAVATMTYFNPTATVENIGTGASATTYVGFYVSTDSTITTDDTFLGYVSTYRVAAGASKTVTKRVRIPAGFTAGTYYLGAIADYTHRADEIDEGNNTMSAPITVYVPTPDLTVTTVSVSPTTAAQRAYITLSGTVSNIGTGKAGANSYAGFYLSDGVTDTFLKQLSVPSYLAAGASRSLSTSYRLPAGFPAGTYREVDCGS